MIFKLTIRCGQRRTISNRFHPSEEQIHRRTESDLPTGQINTSHIYSTIFRAPIVMYDKTKYKFWSTSTFTLENLRLRAGCPMGYGTKIFSTVSRNDVTRSSGKITWYSRSRNKPAGHVINLAAQVQFKKTQRIDYKQEKEYSTTSVLMITTHDKCEPIMINVNRSDVVMTWAKRIYILIIKVNKLISFFLVALFF